MKKKFAMVVAVALVGYVAFVSGGTKSADIAPPMMIANEVLSGPFDIQVTDNGVRPVQLVNEAPAPDPCTGRRGSSIA
ncbi:MAG: hypothetical protein WCC10_04450 [Tumebacillaceae bacterium]